MVAKTLAFLGRTREKLTPTKKKEAFSPMAYQVKIYLQKRCFLCKVQHWLSNTIPKEA